MFVLLQNFPFPWNKPTTTKGTEIINNTVECKNKSLFLFLDIY
jgi:hypothetical protein